LPCAGDDLKFSGSSPKRYELSARASEIDSRAKEHPEINFVFASKDGKPADVQHASVDTSVEPRGKLVIWLMSHNGELFKRLNSYGLPRDPATLCEQVVWNRLPTKAGRPSLPRQCQAGSCDR
jgi:hypothetical protein